MTTSDLHVVFGTGPLGRSVVNELVRRGQRVRVVSRAARWPRPRRASKLRSGDLYSPALVRELTQGAAVAYQCAQPHYWEWPQKFPPLQAAIIEGLTGTGTKLVIGENTYMYGDTAGQAADRGSALRRAYPQGQSARRDERGRARCASGRQGARGAGPRFRLLRPVGAGIVAWRARLLPGADGQGGQLWRQAGPAPHCHLHRGFRPGAGAPGRAGRGAGPGLARA